MNNKVHNRCPAPGVVERLSDARPRDDDEHKRRGRVGGKRASLNLRRLFTSVSLMLCLTSFFPAAYAVEEAKPPQGFSPQLSYAIDFSLVYLDRLKNPVARSDYPTSVDTATKRQTFAQTRALGLGRLALSLDLTLPEESRLHLLFRPDVLNRDDSYTDYDTRSGDVYFTQSKVKFLDEYYLGFDYGMNLDLAFGVFEALTPRYVAYTPILEFGLEVRFPERFSAARIGWRQSKPVVDTQDGADGRGWFADLFILQGNEDRVEAQGVDGSTQDKAPVSQDAHLGIATVFGYDFNDRHHAGVLLGMGKSDYTVDEDHSGTVVHQKGKRDDVYGQIFDSYFLKLSRFSTKLNLDYRILKEKWKSDAFDIQPRTHQSLAASVSTECYDGMWVYGGGSFGKSKVMDKLVVDGYQMDLGVTFNPKKNLFFNLAVAEEHRENKRAGVDEGGFVVNGTPTAIIRRLGLELRYLFNKG